MNNLKLNPLKNYVKINFIHIYYANEKKLN